MNKSRSTKGITLISLVVTIIILLILSGVTITTLIGNNGLINKAQEAKTQTEIASIKEEIQTDILGKQAENQGNISDSNLETILLKYGTLSNEEKLIDKTLTTTKGNHEIKVADIFNGTTIKDVPLKPYVLAEILGGANSPDISGFNCETTHYVTWGTTAPYQINELNKTNTIDKAPPTGWSNYTEKQWANIITTGGGNDCYWVWIPRYAYKITYTDSEDRSKGGTIDVVFLKGQTNKDMNGKDVTSSSYVDSNGNTGAYIVHPAFTNAGNGGFGELTGIWVAKYEASSNAENIVENPTAAQLATNGGGNVTNLQVRVIPNVTSWREINVNNIFTVCRNLTQRGNSLENTNNLNSHMMKNTEWGAVAYLSRSVYGKNSEVWNNPWAYDDTTYYSNITGRANKNNDANAFLNGNSTDNYKIVTDAYNIGNGPQASTTGNVYGVYDMAGGAWEYVAGILSSYKSMSGKYDFTNSDTYPNKYFDWYAGNSSDRNTNYNENTNKYGDAVYETSNSGYSNTGSWDSSFSLFPISSYPVFERGSRAGGGSYAGVFAFNNITGGASTYHSFRPVVLSSQS